MDLVAKNSACNLKSPTANIACPQCRTHKKDFCKKYDGQHSNELTSM
jgi:hypothetical protein